MVDFADLSKVNDMYAEIRAIEGALGNFDAGGKIIGMMISGGESDPPPLPPFDPDHPPTLPPPFVSRLPEMVSTVGWDYPEAMVTSIRNLLTTRHEALTKELADLGVTGEIPPPAR